jgi:hypothetical protein
LTGTTIAMPKRTRRLTPPAGSAGVQERKPAAEGKQRQQDDSNQHPPENARLAI